MVVSNDIVTGKYSTLDNFKSNTITKEPPVTIPAKTVSKPDTVTISAPEGAVTEEKPAAQDVQQPKKKTSLVRKFKNVVASVKKFFIGVGEYTKGTVKGLFYGGVAASSILGIDALRNTINIVKAAKNTNAVKAAAEAAPKAAQKAVSVLSTKGKILAGVAGIAVMGYQLFKASLNATEKKAEVDHRWGSGHNAQ